MARVSKRMFQSSWSATNNVFWQVEVPGIGHASPIVFDKQIFTVSALPETEERMLLCFDRETGGILWQKMVVKSPFEKKHSAQ